MKEEGSLPNMGKELSKTSEKIKNLVEDIDVMAEYARGMGKVISKDIGRSLAELNVFRDSGYAFDVEKDMAKIGSLYSTALTIHNQFIKIVSPATPESLRATERIGKSFRIRNNAINILVYITLAFLALFVITTALLSVSDALKAPLQAVNLLVAAGLGAGFYALSTARRYILQRTYDPRYNQVYYVRLILGLAAGSILGYFGTNMTGGPLAGQLGPSVLAIVGGYSADAVARILQRLADTLVTVVRGSDLQRIEGRERELRAEADETIHRERVKMAKELQKLFGAAREGDSAATQKGIQGLIDELLN